MLKEHSRDDDAFSPSPYDSPMIKYKFLILAYESLFDITFGHSTNTTTTLSVCISNPLALFLFSQQLTSFSPSHLCSYCFLHVAYYTPHVFNYLISFDLSLKYPWVIESCNYDYIKYLPLHFPYPIPCFILLHVTQYYSYELDCVPLLPIFMLKPYMTIFGDMIFQKIIKVKWGCECVALTQ